jgi:multidrug efflux pump subunit AcrA (membrane-fusion protein)
MTNEHSEAILTPPPARRAARLEFVVSLLATVGILVYLLWPGGGPRSAEPAPTAPSTPDQVRLTEAGHLHLRPGSPLERKLQVVAVKPTRIKEPVITVTGTVVASLRSAPGGGRDWQFSSAELLTTYTDWQKAGADIAFTRTQLATIRQLADNRVAAQTALVQRLRKLVAAGTETEKDLAVAQTELIQAQVQGRKDLHEAETAWRLAQRNEAALGRQLQQAGVEADLLRDRSAEVDVVVADVPEAMLSRVRLGQSCEARFDCLGAKVFPGKVRSLSPVLSKERRSLRVLFTIHDSNDQLRPGMFADIGLGTDAREALLVPLAGVVHVDRTDFLLVRAAGSSWRITPVQVGELHETAVEVLDGLRAGDQVIGQGAILLKPLIVEARSGAGSRKR